MTGQVYCINCGQEAPYPNPCMYEGGSHRLRCAGEKRYHVKDPDAPNGYIVVINPRGREVIETITY